MCIRCSIFDSWLEKTFLRGSLVLRYLNFMTRMRRDIHEVSYTICEEIQIHQKISHYKRYALPHWEAPKYLITKDIQMHRKMSRYQGKPKRGAEEASKYLVTKAPLFMISLYKRGTPREASKYLNISLI